MPQEKKPEHGKQQQKHQQAKPKPAEPAKKHGDAMSHPAKQPGHAKK